MTAKQVKLIENYIRKQVRKTLRESTGKFRVDVGGVGENSWSTNSMRFDTEEEGVKYAKNLLGRWYGADIARVVPESTPSREKIDLQDPTICINDRRRK